MPARAALNAYYALRVKHLDAKQRRTFDDSLYGFDEQNKAADRALFAIEDESGGEG
jgi:hypothetical protein